MKSATFIVETEAHRGYAIRYMEREALPFQVEIGPAKEQRSITANARLWLLHTMAAEHTGYSPEEMHEFSLCRYFGYTEIEVKDLFTGEILMKRVPRERSSTKDRAKFAQFMEATEIWYGNELGCWLPAGEYA